MQLALWQGQDSGEMREAFTVRVMHVPADAERIGLVIHCMQRAQ